MGGDDIHHTVKIDAGSFLSNPPVVIFAGTGQCLIDETATTKNVLVAGKPYTRLISRRYCTLSTGRAYQSAPVNSGRLPAPAHFET
jgi:hypothetical protein